MLLVTEYVPGGSLLALLQRRTARKPLPVHTVADLAAQAAAGVAHLHASGVLHRDLACRNILVRNACCVWEYPMACHQLMCAVASGGRHKRPGPRRRFRVCPCAARWRGRPHHGQQRGTCQVVATRSPRCADTLESIRRVRVPQCRVAVVPWGDLHCVRVCACVCSYSFGCCVYEMVSGGKSPWEHLSPYEAAMKVIGGASPASLLSAGTTGRVAV